MTGKNWVSELAAEMDRLLAALWDKPGVDS
jgi:hypothetical protein